MVSLYFTLVLFTVILVTALFNSSRIVIEVGFHKLQLHIQY